MYSFRFSTRPHYFSFDPSLMAKGQKLHPALLSLQMPAFKGYILVLHLNCYHHYAAVNEIPLSLRKSMRFVMMLSSTVFERENSSLG